MTSSLRGVVRSIVRPHLSDSWKNAYYLHLFQRLQPEEDALCCREYVHPGDAVLDLGANIGAYTKVLSEYVGVEGQVHCLEPIPETFGYLFNNVHRLGLQNVFCYNVAASDQTGLGYAAVPEYGDGGPNFYQAHLSDSGIRIRVFRLDDLFGDLCPTFIKCDVEDRELDVISGAKNMIERCHPVWLMEVCAATENAVMKMMGGNGYRGRKLEKNWLFVPASTAA
jgi:FkbM family methyltransferase